MKNQTMHKRMIGVVIGIALFVVLFYTQPVEAIEYCKNPNSSSGEYVDAPESTLSGRYGLSLETIDNTHFKIVMNPSTNKAERCKTTFKLSKINGVEVDGGEVTCDQPLTFTESNYIDDTSSGLPGITATLSAEDIIKNEHESGSCYYKYGNVTFEATIELAPTRKIGNCPAVPIEETGITINYIDCNNNYAEGSFEYKFCYAKKMAGEQGHTYDDNSPSITNGKFTGSASELTFKCNYDVTKIPMNPEDLQGDNYYVNKNYIYGKTVQSYNMGNYIYHYGPGEETKGKAITCEITCEEAVEVEYGPPVASSAGMCFEYKVRVTSRVSCNMSKTPDLPPAECGYCTPSPHCVGSSGRVWLQGGPNEEFDSCVQSCDGGKYTQKCSNECYKKVYGSNIKANAKINSTFFEDTTTKIRNATNSLSECMSMTDENGKKYNPYGCYYRSGGAIKWKSSGERHWYGNLETTGEGRWYTEHPGGKYHNGNYIQALSDGFWRHDYGSDFCHDTCSWVSCGKNEYLNPGMAEQDYRDNIDKYNQAVISCRGKASCSTTTATFTISTDYTKKDGTSVTIDFPTFGKDNVKHSGGSVSGTYEETDLTTFLVDEPNPGEGLLGCYKNGAKETNLYRATWGFPGTWMNLKTGEISFSPKPGKTAWYFLNHMFCLPGDAKAVNAAWTNAYLRRKMEVTGLLSQVSVTDPEIEELCHYATNTGSVVNHTYNITEDQITFNIHAKTQDFGYFNWDINMECFYGITENPLCEGDSCSDRYTDCVANPEKYRVRSTELEDLFPSTDGSQKAAENAGRLPGFNWSKYAINNKDTDYKSNPVTYMEALQKRTREAKASGKEIYTEENLDYEFILMPETIREMRKSAAGNMGGGNYTDFKDEDFTVDNGFGRYRSSKIRSIAGSNKIPDKPAINCNNMLNYGSNECDPVHNN